MSWKDANRPDRYQTAKILRHMTKEERLHALLMVLRKIHERKQRQAKS